MVDEKKGKVFFLIFGLYLMIYFYLGVLPANIDNFLQDLPGATQLGVGLAITFSLLTGTLSMLIFGYFGGMIARRITRKKLFIITNSIWISANTIISVSPNYAFFLCFFLIAAIGNGAFLPIGFAIIGDLYRAEERGNKFGFMQLGLLLGNGLGVVIGGITGWRVGFLTASILGLLVLIGYSRYGINVVLKSYNSNEIKVYNYKITFRDLLKLFKIRTVTGILLFVVCSGIATSTLANWSVFYLNLKLGNKGMAILLYLIAGLGALPGAVLGGSLGDIYFQSGKIKGRVIVSMVGVICGTVLLLSFFLSPFILFGLTGFFFSFFSTGNQFAIFSDVVEPKLRGTVNSMSGIMTNIGGIMGNLLVSTLIQTNIYMVSVSIIIVLVIWLIGSLFWLIPYMNYLKDIHLKKVSQSEVYKKEILNRAIP
ncbi:MAG TPA: MFS transporter [bacterium]|nr:MFS transporter [bacterium]